MHRAKQTILKMISGVGNDTQYTCGWRRFARIASDPAAATWYHPSTEEAKAKPSRLVIRRITVKRLKLDPPGEPVSASASAYAPCQPPPIITPPPITTHPLMAHPVCVPGRMTTLPHIRRLLEMQALRGVGAAKVPRVRRLKLKAVRVQAAKVLRVRRSKLKAVRV